MKVSIDGISAILFDMDGTLVNSVQAVENAWRAWAQKHGLEEKIVLNTAHGRPARDSIHALAPHADQEAEAAWVLNRELSEDAVVAIPGSAKLLAALADFPWAIVTSANRSLALYRLALANLPVPKILITVEDVSRGKPAPEGYLRAAQMLKIPPKNCLVIEDTPAGLTAGHSAGMRCLGITTTFPREHLQAEAIVENYLDVSLCRDGEKLTLQVQDQQNSE